MKIYLTDQDNEDIDNLFKNNNILNFYFNLPAETDIIEKDTPEVLFKRAKESIKSFKTYRPNWWRKT